MRCCPPARWASASARFFRSSARSTAPVCSRSSDQLSASLAYTTVMTTLDRLFRKGFLERKKQDRAYIYSAALTSREIEGQRAAGLVRRFFADSGESPEVLLSCLVDAVHRYDTTLLDQLEDKIRRAREQQAGATAKSKEAS